MKLYLFFSISVLFSVTTSAQKSSDNWYFGNHAGLNFSNGIPVALNSGALSTQEGCSSISDAFGNLLFYSDGITVWNNSHNVMPNGNGLTGGWSSTQSALIVPKPGSSTEYFIFTVDQVGGPDGFRYSIVDMTLQSGSGDVTLKNVLIMNNVTEKLTAVQQIATSNYWIAVHQGGSDAFYLYLLTSSGLQVTPVINNIGIIHSSPISQNSAGQMKFNFCGDKLAMAASHLDTVEIFDFNSSTGILSNPITIPMGNHIYGVEFSVDSRLLYVSTYPDSSGTLFQFDLSSGDSTMIVSSKVVLTNISIIESLQMANNGKIYVAKFNNTFLAVIDTPSTLGLACHYIDSAVNINPMNLGMICKCGLPGFVQSSVLRGTDCMQTGLQDEFKTSDDILISPNPSHSTFNIQLTNRIQIISLDLFDMTGKKLEHNITTLGETSITVGQFLMPGVYLVCLKDSKRHIWFKLVKV